MDGVVADLHSPWLALYNAEYGDNLTPEKLSEWGVHPFVKPECGTKVYEYLDHKGLFASAPVIPGAQDGIRALLEMGCEVFFVTTAPLHSQWAILEKSEWIDKHFPEVGAGNMVFTRHKHLVRGDMLIDDYHGNLEKFQGHDIIFDQPWNRATRNRSTGLHGTYRAFGWDDLINHIKGF
jgi:5'-nucleotidase